jgi:fatty-acyl-CoA synthase
VDVQAAFAREQILLVNGYGMTEVGTVFGMPLDAAVSAAKPRSVGVAPPSVQTRVVDEQDRDCPEGTPGELLVRGDNVFLGYFGEPEETRRAFADGWFRTGDIVRVDSDGYFTLVDRKKDMFISGGENVYPAEVEACLVGFPGIEGAAVVGVPDPAWGEVGHLALVASVGSEPDPQLVRDYLYTQLARYKVPKYISVVDHLPRTGSGKVSKKQLRDQLLKDFSSPA